MYVTNLKLYRPPYKKEGDGADWKDYNKVLQSALQAGAMFYVDEAGLDWYKVRDSWPKNGRYKLAFKEDGWIYCHSKDIQEIIVHEGTSVVEVPSLPENFFEHHYWYWRDGKLVEDIETAQTKYRNRLMRELDERINVLQNRVDDDDAEERHVEELKQKRSIRVALRKLDMKVKVETWPVI